MLKNCLFVALGGGLGAVARYLLSLVALPWAFPLITLVTNFLGAVVIGGVVALSAQVLPLDPRLMLFLKTGLCGGFTTFSTFSLETVTLLERHEYITAGSYMAASVGLCLLGVLLGQALVRELTGGLAADI